MKRITRPVLLVSSPRNELITGKPLRKLENKLDLRRGEVIVFEEASCFRFLPSHWVGGER
jgi:hypothetical protein